MTVRQNLPLIVHPKGLAPNREPWTLLKWQVKDGKLVVVNDSAYVVRMDPTVVMHPSNKTATLARGYVLPGETLVATSEGTAAGKSVTIAPARSEEHTSELQSLMRISYAVFCLKKKKTTKTTTLYEPQQKDR